MDQTTTDYGSAVAGTQPAASIEEKGDYDPQERVGHARRRVRKSAELDALLLFEQARDESLSLTERSNAFDAWQSAVHALVSGAAQKRSEYRQLLGLLCL